MLPTAAGGKRWANSIALLLWPGGDNLLKLSNKLSIHHQEQSGGLLHYSLLICPIQVIILIQLTGYNHHHV